MAPLGAARTHPAAIWQRFPGWAAGPQEGADHILRACLWLLGTSSQLPALFLPRGGCGRIGDGAAIIMEVRKESLR